MSYRDLVRRSGRLREKAEAEFKEAVDDAGRARREFLGKKRKPLTPAQKQAMREKQKGRCSLSGEPLVPNPTADHTIPFSRGGGEEVENKTLANPGPNRAKGNKVKHRKLYPYLVKASQELGPDLDDEED